MEALEEAVLSVGKSVVSKAVDYAGSAIANEVALQLGVHRDQAFIADELEMMQGFLMTAYDERQGDRNKVVKIWVKQVRDVAYDVEDCLQDFAVRVVGRRRPSWRWCWWRIPRTLLDRRRVAKKMKELRAKVEDVSHRNMRYHLINGSAASNNTKPATTDQHSSSAVASTTMSGMEEETRQRDKAKSDLLRLINSKDDDLRVIAVSGAANTDDLGEASFIKTAYEHLTMHKMSSSFQLCAWISLMRPFDPTQFIRGIVEEFHVTVLQETSGDKAEKAIMEAQVLRGMGMKKGDGLAQEFMNYIKDKRYLIVLTHLSTVEDWECITACFPNNNKRSRIIVCTEQVGVASLCVGPVNAAPQHKQLSAHHTIYAFFDKGLQDTTGWTEARPSSDTADIGKSLAGTETRVSALKESELVGRATEKKQIIQLIINEHSQQREVISLWGMSGLGKTILAKDVYHNQELSSMFEKRACVTIKSPFDRDSLISELRDQLVYKKKDDKGMMAGKTKPPVEKPLHDLLEGKKYLIVLDDLSSTTEWDAIISHLPPTPTSRIVITTSEENIAKHCSVKDGNMYNLPHMNPKDGRDLFTKKVFGKITDLDEQHPEMVKEADQMLKNCSGLPLAIVIIGGFLAKQQKTALEWRKLNEHMGADFDRNTVFGPIKTVLNKSFDGLPHHLKSCFLYLAIFPEDWPVSRSRLVRRWIAEGYSSVVLGISAEEMAESYFKELIRRSMLLPYMRSIYYSRKGTDFCQVHDLIRKICISKSTEENLVFTLEEGCSLNSKMTVRHLAVSNEWSGDQSEFESSVDLSCVRSLTVFAEWKKIFISDKMRLLRVLDLEDTSGLLDHHLEHIGKLLHLKYLSLRGQESILHLPDSLGNLRQLETLDVRDTKIVKLPKSIIKLQKIAYIRAGSTPRGEDVSYEESVDGLPEVVTKNNACLLTLWSVMLCAACCGHKSEHFTLPDDMNRRDICTAFCCALLPVLAMRLDMHGVLVPRGMKKLKALHTLGVVNIARGKAVLRDIQELTRLRKLGVTGISKRNSEDLCSTLANLSHLETLFLRSEGNPGLSGCLDGISSPPEKLQSLKLYGNLVKLPRWIQELQNLVKLNLRSTRLWGHDASMQVLGKLPKLAILRLFDKSFQGEKLCFQTGAFRSLILLELQDLGDIKLVKFEKEAMPKLEQLIVTDLWSKNEVAFFGLDNLASIKQVWLSVRFQPDYSKMDSSDPENETEQIEELEKEAKLKEDKWKQQFQGQLARNKNNPILKVN